MTWIEKFVDIFKNFKYYYAIDILLISFLFYLIFAFLKQINSTGFIKYLIIGAICCGIVYIFRNQLKTTYALIFTLLINFCVLFTVIYLSDIRRVLWSASAPKALRSSYTNKFNCTDEELEQSSVELIRAVQNLAKSNTGALIVLASNDLPSQIIDSGTKVDAIVSSPLLESIFFPNTALHDGAVIIRGNKIVAAGCFLPLSQNLNVPKDLGTRHRAALGVSEDTMVTTLIVSEETGIISVAKNGILSRYYDSHMLKDAIGLAYGIVSADSVNTKKKRKRIIK